MQYGESMSYFKLPPGVRDILPEECRAFDGTQRILREKFLGAGFQPVRPAGLEYYDTYAGIRSSIRQKRMFKMTDQDGSLIVLRPDMTLACARIAATKIREPRIKLCYFSDVYNFTAYGNSDREVAQAGVEVFGESGAFSDACILAFAAECLQAAGVEKFVIDVGHVGFFKGLLEGSGLTAAQAETLRGYINAKDSLNIELSLQSFGIDKKAREALCALPSLFGGAEVLDRAESLTDNEKARGALVYLKEMYGYLRELGADRFVTFDLGTIRQLSYYSGIVFSGLAEGAGAPVLSGGRYDGLCGQFGRDLSAVGFAVGMSRILSVVSRKGEEKKMVAVVCREGGRTEGREFARGLRERGIACDLFADGRVPEEGYAKVYVFPRGAEGDG